MSRAKRKLEHIQHAISTGQDKTHGLDDITFVHQSLPNTSVNEIDLQTSIGELSISSPIFINAMTGGGGEQTRKVNRLLSEVAKECGLGMAVGSQMSAIKDPGERYTYEVVREVNPTGVLFANLGSEATVDNALSAIDMIEANGIQIHLNVIQELAMPEGERNFSGALSRIEKIVNSVQVPVIVKEVGFGLSTETAYQLRNIGVSILDIGGFGGTNFARIENNRSNRRLDFFDEWGITTAASIAEVSNLTRPIPIISSGGLQDALDIAKSIALGASAAAFAGVFLKILLQEGQEKLVEHIDQMKADLKYIMTALGTRSINELQKSPVIIKGETFHWLNQRGIDTAKYSHRR
ncbi:type 2 isopentenyl-diphosphate Delta-isomerase [Bacillus luteolus]|uniref:Isopentenyl-diphosphate delta-isomerase n=1 Tax=Litchfieldia luteola TaxID=682179 RepID=A0ABR9QP73_9BACI|nr:type 2 isopentenyl-diphosphate Delta-isomerase [Cytobacillus luteolus]MBE4910303.1 type 2 isopentenyl-diphosphate Delta-isomerase [Cytobacillus luteolus]MBP1942123.1 isopentenyl-diphosphate delta-isomerase [Cytobacillus luteolus]